MMPANLTGHLVDDAGLSEAQFVANVQQVGKVTPAFDAAAIVDQIAQYRRLPNVVGKPQTTEFHGIDDVTQHPLKGIPVPNITAPEQVNGQSVSLDQMVSSVSGLKPLQLSHGNVVIDFILLAPVILTRFSHQCLGMMKLGNGSMVHTVVSEKVGLFPTQFDMFETGFRQGTDASIALPGQKIPFGQLNGADFPVVVAVLPPFAVRYATLGQMFLHFLTVRLFALTAQR